MGGSSEDDGSPAVTKDPRFLAGRHLVQTGKAGEGAIDTFASLLEEVRSSYGEASLEASILSYEYGNALFRAAARNETAEEEEEEQVKEEDENENDNGAGKPKDDGDAAPTEDGGAEKKEQNDDSTKENGETTKNSNIADSAEGGTQTNTNESNQDDSEAAAVEEIDDTDLALELMETAWSILDKYVNEENNNNSETKFMKWSKDQLPRYLLGIGDVLTALERHADAADAYSRAIPYREEALEQYNSAAATLDLNHLKTRRQLVEANVLVAEALLACPPNEDVVTTETKDTLVKSSERVEFARGYYDKAREELQETVFLMGKIAASGKNVESEKEDVCFISTLLMGVGTTLAELDENKEAEVAEDSKPPHKKLKTI